MTTKTPHAALRAASKLGSFTNSPAELARQVKAELPDISLAACRRAADVVLAGRMSRRRHTVRTRKLPAAVRLDLEGTLPYRVLAHKESKVAAAFADADFRHSRAWANDGTITITFGPPAARQATDAGWINYKSHGYRQGIVSETVWLSVPLDWGTRVKPLNTTAGILLLDTDHVAAATGDIEVYRAVWARQGRGVSLETERGVIALHRPTGESYHLIGSDIAKAARGLARKLVGLAVPVEIRDAQRSARYERQRERQGARLARLIEMVARHDLSEVAHVAITRTDSIRAGNCVPGTDAFIERFFPNGEESTTIGAIAARVRPEDLAKSAGRNLTVGYHLAAACLHAIRRDRSARRLVGV